MSSHQAVSPNASARPHDARRRAAWTLCALALAAGVVVGAPAPARADCMIDIEGRVICDRGQCLRDIEGEVFCSRYKDGVALRNTDGEVVCGRGRCVITLEGDIICSARPGGAALIDLYGKVTCEGGCELASPRLCGQEGGVPDQPRRRR